MSKVKIDCDDALLYGRDRQTHSAQSLNLTRHAIYVFDYGAPTGFRLAASHPDQVVVIISQNGNAYADGLGDAWDPIKKYWKDPTPGNREALRELIGSEGTKFQ